MRASAPGIALRRLPAESSPVGGGRAAWPLTARDPERVPRWTAALVLGLLVWLFRDHAPLGRRRRESDRGRAAASLR